MRLAIGGSIVLVFIEASGLIWLLQRALGIEPNWGIVAVGCVVAATILSLMVAALVAGGLADEDEVRTGSRDGAGEVARLTVKSISSARIFEFPLPNRRQRRSVRPVPAEVLNRS